MIFHQVSMPGGDLTSFLWLLLTPFTILWAMITSFFGGVSVSPSSSNPSSSSRPSSSRFVVVMFQLLSKPTSISRPGGIGRLRRSENDNDENNTYNGNSTQQM